MNSLCPGLIQIPVPREHLRRILETFKLDRFPKYTGPRLHLRYTDADELQVLYHIRSGENHSISVVGNPDMGAYEWLVEMGDKVDYSDAGYGESDVALRDGLIVFHGLPDRTPAGKVVVS